MEDMSMAEIIVVANQKGGVGKTTTTLNLAYSLKALDIDVLLVDMDPQANLTRCLGIDNPTKLEKTIGHLMMEEVDCEEYKADEYICTCDGIDFIPSSIYLSVVETQLKSETGSEKVLSEIIDKVRDNYDVVLIDTSPSLGILTINALCSADSILITADTQMFAMVGLQDLIKTITKIKKRLHSAIEIKGIALTMCNNRTNLSKTIIEQVKENYGEAIRVFDTIIPQTVKIGEAIYYGQSIKKYAKKSKADIAYDSLAREVWYE